MVYFGNKPTTRHVLHFCGSLQDEAEVYNSVRCVLNKLTPEKFDILIAQINSAPLLENVDLSARIADLIIDKASEEELYSNLYAEFCRSLSINALSHPEDLQDVEDTRMGRLDTPLLESTPSYSSQFNDTISEKCSRLFETYLEELEHNSENRDEDRQRVYRKKAVGFMKFVGELYRSEVLSEAFIADLLRQLSEEPSLRMSAVRIELASKLLATAGQVIETAIQFSSELKDVWCLIWERLEGAKNENGLSTRLRYMVYDLLELKTNGWTPRKFLRERQPATLADIRLQGETERSLDIKNSVKSQQSKAKKIEEQLTGLLRDPHRLNVFINQNKTAKGNRRHLVVFALMRAIIKTSLTESRGLELEEEKLTVLRDFIQSDVELEAVCINALQNLIIIHLGSPQGLLYKAFDRLYKSGVLSLGGFQRWKDGPELPKPGRRKSTAALVSPFLLGSEGRNRATVIAAAYLLSL